jgi:MFS family permease
VSLGPKFNRLWTASAVSNLGDGVMGAAFPLLVASLTRDPFSVAAATVANRLPWFFFALLSGALVDRMDRKRVMVVTDVIRFGLVGVLGAFVLTEDITLPVIYVIGFMLGTAETFFDTSTEAFLPTIVEPGRLESANGRIQATEWVANAFVGPPLGAFLFGIAAAVPFLINAGSYLLAAIAIALIAGSYRSNRTVTTGLVADIGEGLRWLWGHTVLRTLSIMAGITNMVAFGIIAIFVLFIQDVVELGDVGFGIMLSVMGVGGLAGALLAPRVVSRIGRARTLLTSVLMLGICTSVQVTFPNPIVVGVGMGLIGSALTLWNVVAVSLRQALTPDELRGRVASVARLLAWGTQPVGAIVGGLMATWLGLRAPFYIAAATWVVLVLAASPIITERNITNLEASAG